MKITILGCGNSGGVPLIGNRWGECDPSDPRNRRTRASIMVEEGPTSLLVDTSPDLRAQLLANNVQNVTAVLYTHSHADHSHGIDDLRAVNWLMKKSIPFYATPQTMEELRRRFDYVIYGSPDRGEERFYKPSLEPHIISGPFTFDGIHVTPFAQEHGETQTTGYRFNDFAYSPDAKSLDDNAFEALKGVKIWVVDCMREREHSTHSHLAQTLAWIEKIRPKQAFLTHMDQTMDYSKLVAKLPSYVHPAYDGLEIDI